jgi:ABC-type nickel/cobalt efflux system permease component RcnA
MHHNYLDIPMVILIFVLFQNRIYFQIIPAILFSLVNLTLLILKGALSISIAFNTIILSYILAVIIGTFISWRYHIFRRKQYKAWINEKKVKEKLLEANENVKVLSGLMPICASCKKIRDDKGYWKQLEEYIEKHSEAQFSHSLCEECAEKLYGGQDWFRE